MPIANDDNIKAVAKMLAPGNIDIRNVFHFKYLGTGDADSESQQIIDAIEGDYATYIMPHLWDEFTFTGMDVYDLSQDRLIGSEAFNVAGGRTLAEAAMLPLQVAAVVTASTTVLRSRGRKFLTVVAEDQQGLGVITNATLLGDLAAWAALWITSIATENGRFYPGILIKGGPAFAGFTEVAVRTLLGTMRRRKPGVGS